MSEKNPPSPPQNDFESRTVATLLRSAPAGLIWIAGFLLFAGALIRSVYWGAIFWPLYSGAVLAVVIAAVFLVALSFGALRLFLMMSSGRDFKMDNQVGGWMGLAMSVAAFAYDLYDAYTAAIKFDGNDPEIFLAMIGFIAAVHTCAFAMEIRLVFTMFSDVLEKRRSEDRTLEDLSIAHAAEKTELNRKLQEAEKRNLQLETEVKKQKLETEAEVKKQKLELEAHYEKRKLETEADLKKRKEETEAELKKQKSELEAENRKLRSELDVYSKNRAQAETQGATQNAAHIREKAALEIKIRELGTEKTELQRKLQEAEKRKIETEAEVHNRKLELEAALEENRKLQEENRNFRLRKSEAKTGSQAPASDSEKPEAVGTFDPEKTEAIWKAINFLKSQNQKATHEAVSATIKEQGYYPQGISSKTVGLYVNALQIQYK